MAKVSVNIDAQCAKILSDVREGRFSPLYLLMGDEPYYPELTTTLVGVAQESSSEKKMTTSSMAQQ